MGKSNMNKKLKDSKKVGTNSGNINNIALEAVPAIVSEETTHNMKENYESDKGQSLGEKNDTSDVAQADDTSGDGSEADEEWDLKTIMSIDAMKQASPIKCSHETCLLVAATVWVSNQKPTDNWYSCLDCQVITLLTSICVWLV